MTEVRLQGAGIMPLVRQRIAARVPEHVRERLEAEPRLDASTLDLRATPAVLKGAPRSEVNTNGDTGSCSRWRRRRARSSSPRIGWVLGVPRFTLRTCSVPEANST
jgi:hypothetical protein